MEKSPGFVLRGLVREFTSAQGCTQPPGVAEPQWVPSDWLGRGSVVTQLGPQWARLSLTHVREPLGDPDGEICHRNESNFLYRNHNFRFLFVAHSEMLLKRRNPLTYWEVLLFSIISELLLLPVLFVKDLSGNFLK